MQHISRSVLAEVLEVAGLGEDSWTELGGVTNAPGAFALPGGADILVRFIAAAGYVMDLDEVLDLFGKPVHGRGGLWYWPGLDVEDELDIGEEDDPDLDNAW